LHKLLLEVLVFLLVIVPVVVRVHFMELAVRANLAVVVLGQMLLAPVAVETAVAAAVTIQEEAVGLPVVEQTLMEVLV
jgi:hypothetical protein